MSETRRSLKSSGSEGQSGNLVIVKGKTLAEEGKTGIVASGKYEKVDVTTEGKFKGSKSFFIRDTAADTLYIVNGTKVLNEQMDQLNPADGTNVEIAYLGQKTSKAGTNFHDFEVFVRG